MLELNARLQVTSWSQPETEDLTQYAYKLWSGMLLDFYKPRWQRFYKLVRESIKDKKPLDEKVLLHDVIDSEKSWIYAEYGYPTTPSGDSIEISKALYEKYVKVSYAI